MAVDWLAGVRPVLGAGGCGPFLRIAGWLAVGVGWPHAAVSPKGFPWAGVPSPPRSRGSPWGWGAGHEDIKAPRVGAGFG